MWWTSRANKVISSLLDLFIRERWNFRGFNNSVEDKKVEQFVIAPLLFQRPRQLAFFGFEFHEGQEITAFVFYAFAFE